MMVLSGQQVELRRLVEKVGYTASFRYLTSSIAMETALLEEKKSKDKSSVEDWLSIAAILESRGK